MFSEDMDKSLVSPFFWLTVYFIVVDKQVAENSFLDPKLVC